MGNKAIQVENLGKAYQLGQIGTGTISRDIERWWATKVRGKADPYLKIGETNDRTAKGESDIVWSLQDINFSIEQGDAVGIIGRNGAGKSTLLKLLSRVTAPTTGNIKVKGRIASLLEVGTGFHPELSGRENIYLNGAILGMRKKEIDRKFDEIVDFSGVERYVDTPVKRYSSGMYVRLAFAVAAHLESEILIVDEVLAVGDAEFQKKCLGKMGEVSQGEGRTVLFVSHNMASIKSLCKTGIFLKNGCMMGHGNVDNIIHEYLNEGIDKAQNTVDFKEVEKPIYFKSITIVNSQGVSKNKFEIFDEIYIQIEYVVREEISRTNIALELMHETTVILKSWDLDLHPELYKSREPGTYKAKILLPKNLNFGNYSLNIDCGIPSVGVIQRLENCIHFEIENISIDGNLQSFTRGGMIAEKLNWYNNNGL